MIIIHCDWILFLKDSFFLLFYMAFFNPLLRLVKPQPKATENRGSEVETLLDRSDKLQRTISQRQNRYDNFLRNSKQLKLLTSASLLYV